MNKVYIAIGLGLVLQGCVLMPKKTFDKERELWQNIGRMSGYVECQQQVLSNLRTVTDKDNLVPAK